MLINLKFCKFDEKDAKFGFRLIGGSDFDSPLTVIKVEEESLAEKAGMMVGDVIVRINDESTVNMTHLDAHAVLKKSGNNFMLGILRQDDNINNDMINDEQSLSQTPIMSPSQFSLSEKSFETSPKPTVNELNEINELNNCYNKIDEHININTMDETIVQEQNELINHIPDEVIAEMISGEAEVLKDHNVLGVNFKKIIPQSGVFKNSQVFKQLNAEAIKTKEEMDKEQKKWSTFLQKPNRPIPQKRTFLEELKLNGGGYKVEIVKQPKPRVAPGRTPTPPPAPPTPTPEPEHIELIKENQTLEGLIEKVIGHSDTLDQTDVEICDDDVPDLHPINNETYDENITNEQDVNPDLENGINSDVSEIETIEEYDDLEPIIEKTKEELYLEQQLAAVQNQLLALSNLPLTIQKTLDAVTAKLSELVPAIQSQVRRRSNGDSAGQEIVSKDLEMQEGVTVETDSNESENNENGNSENGEILETENSFDETVEHQDTEHNQNISIEKQQIIEVIESEKTKKIEEQKTLIESDWEFKKQQEEVEMEHQQRLIRDNATKRPPNRAFFPLTPNSDRGICLPGGRKWRNEKDAFNEEFIKDVLTSQAELIMGTTIGKSYESPLLGYDERVNFLKYQKPEKKVNIENSEVYRLVHHMDSDPKHGIEVRSEKCVAAQDIRVV